MEEAIISVVVAAAVAAAVAATYDGRSDRRPPEVVWTAPVSPWGLVRGNPLYDGWYRLHLRCSLETFTNIAQRIESKWEALYMLPGPASVYDITTRVAITLCYLTHENSFALAGTLFGASKSRCIAFVDEVTEILNVCFLPEAVRLPSSPQEWRDVAAGFELVCGVPNAVGAIDGSLFPVHRFADFEGWYCRKGFPAFNMQVVVDSKKRFMSFSLRSGSQNDKAVYNNSEFGAICKGAIPRGMFFLADAGYKLQPHVMIPYKIFFGMPREEARYNYLHSKMRIVVEMALGLLKGRFRLFKSALRHHSPEKMARLISASTVLHNWLIDYGDTTVLCETEEWMYVGGDGAVTDDPIVSEDEVAKNRRNFIKEYMMTL